MLEFQVLEHVFDDLVVEVVAAEMVVAVTGDHFDHAGLDPHHGDIEGAAAEVIDQDALALMLRRLIDERRRSRFVDDAHHLQPGDFASLARCLPLRVGEIGGHGDHRLLDRPPQPVVGRSPSAGTE